MVEAGLFISIVIVAVTQLIKYFAAKASVNVSGGITILVAFIVGIAVALLSYIPAFGLEHITIAAGIISALGAIGFSVLAGKAGGGSAGDGTVTR